MKMRKIALLLALILCMSAILPVNARAAGKEPVVLHTREDSSGSYRYFYDGEGNCVFEERICGGVCEETYYSYSLNGALADKQVYQDGKIREETLYDAFGNMTEHREYSGENVWIWEGKPEYDTYGRLTWHTTVGPCDADYNLAEYYDKDSVRYEYYDDPVTLFFGHYEQDGNTQNGPEPIEWEVLETDGTNMLLISKYALDSRVYHGKDTDVSWRDSDLRAWLNSEFLETAFVYSEYYQLREVQLEDGARDYVFLLSQGEAEHYFPDDQDRLCEATGYAVRRGAYVNRTTGGSWWLLRTPGTAEKTVMSINSDGTMDYDGGKVTSRKGTVRPVMWVSVTAMRGNAVPSRVHEWKDSYESSPEEPARTWASLSTYNEGILFYVQMESSDSRGWWTSERYMYDDSGNITDGMISTTYSTGEEDLHYYTYENTYDSAGHLTMQTQLFDGNPEERIQYRYDWAGRMISRTKASPGKTWKICETENWTYDRNGNVLKYKRNGKVEAEYTYVPLSKARWEGVR